MILPNIKLLQKDFETKFKQKRQPAAEGIQFGSDTFTADVDTLGWKTATERIFHFSFLFRAFQQWINIFGWCSKRTKLKD